MGDMNERELLEAAARAAGYDTAHPWNAMRLELKPPVASLCIPDVSTAWNTIEDDGHCARLEAELNIELEWRHDRVTAQIRRAFSAPPIQVTEPYVDHGGDKNRARRYASTRAAAVMAKEKED